MTTLIIATYLTLMIALIFWTLTDIAFARKIKEKGILFWWILILLMPAIGPILYFQNKDKREFKPKFDKH
ncbi:MAG: PLDc N-terminal domain-containing protein [Chryseotalea sp.]